MRARPLLAAFVVAAVPGLSVAGGCSAGNDAGTGGGGLAPSSGNGDGGSTGNFTGSSGTGSDCITCSSDLHNVIDCDGNILQACPPDQGCSPSGACVPACTAATENKSTIGCDFFSVTPACIAEARGGCFAAMVANTWTSPVTVTAEFAGMTLNVANHLYIPQGQGAGLTYQLAPGGQLPAGELGILFLSSYESGDIYQVDCPAGVQPALLQNTQLDFTGLSNAFHIATTAPVVMYDVYPWGGAASYVSSATLLLPTPTWGNNFVTADAWTASAGQPFTQIVASEDNTMITMVPTVNVTGGAGLPTMTANTSSTFTLNRGQVAQFLQFERLAGSVLQSDKPVSVWGGASCMNIPDGQGACDAAHQQILPVQTLGTEYLGARYPPRQGAFDDQAPYMIVGMVDGTTLTYDPMPPGAPATLNQGQVAVFFTDQAFSVRSQDETHPFYVATYMTGGGTTSTGVGDPEYVNLVPPAQYLNSYLFATDPTYGNTSLVFVRKKDGGGIFHDVSLDCMGTVTGWTPVGGGGLYEVARIKLTENFIGMNGCDNGKHTATSPAPFGLTVWGYDSYASYGYPAGMAVDSINTVVVPPVPQ